MSIKLYNIETIHCLERAAIHEFAIPEQTLMARAGKAAFQILRTRWPMAKKIAVVCGKGNNGGDGYVVAKLAQEQGLYVTVYPLAEIDALQGAARKAANEAKQAGVTFSETTIANWDLQTGYDVVVDALLGIGLQGEVRGDYAEAIAVCNQSSAPILAIDAPSGLEVDTGVILGDAVKANATVTFIARKVGLFTGQGVAVAGDVFCHDLDLPKQIWQQVKPSAVLQTELTALPRRNRDAHKGNFGHVVVIGGGKGMAGAVRMAGEAALRVGAGLVTVATRPEHVAVVTSMRPELMCKGVESAIDLAPLLQRATVLVLGPGLGQSTWSQECFEKALLTSLPLVVDADGVNLLAKHPQQNQQWVLTPHPGEAARLLNMSTSNTQLNRLRSANQLTNRYQGVCVLKGAGTVVQAQDTLPIVCQTGNPGMASGGMGDVLSGIIGGLIAQGLSLKDAAVTGVMLHGYAADLAAAQEGERGLIATDLMPFLHKLVN